MTNAQNLLNQLRHHGATVAVQGNNLRVQFKQAPGPEVAPLMPELKRCKGEVIEFLRSLPNAIDGHTVRRIVWETEKAIVFEDDEGHFWRYLHAYKQSWPVIVTSRKESA